MSKTAKPINTSPNNTQPNTVSSAVRIVDISDDDAGQRVDNYLLRELKGVPKSRIYRILRKGEVRVNGGRIKASHRLKEGDRLRIPPIRTAAPNAPIRPPDGLRALLESRILFEDSHFLALNKPAGLAVHGGSGLSFGIIEVLRVMRPDVKGLELVHRLDKATSGCLLLAKRRSALRSVHEQLRERKVQKQYLLLAQGNWTEKRCVVDKPLQKNILKSGERIVRVDPEGKSAKTRFIRLQRWPELSLVEAYPHTGRTHQIRVHAQSLGNPIVGDEKYGGDRPIVGNQLPERLFLHSRSLQFDHPKTGKRLAFYAPLDPEWFKLLEKLNDV